MICSQLKNSTSTHLDHLVQITNRKIDQIFIKHATRNSSTKNLSQIYEFIDLLSGTYRNSNNYLKKAEREIGSVNKRGLRALVQTKINERTSAILNKYKVKDTKANKRIISKGLYLYDHNPLCAEKNLLYQSSKLAPSYFQLLGNKQKTLEFAFNLDENHELRSIEKCKSCKAIETILNYQTAQVCIEQRVTWSSPIKTSENITGVFSGFKDKQGREQQHSERCSHDEQTTSSRLLGQETPSITNEGAAEESIDPTLTKRRLFSDPGEFLDGNLAEANKPTYADIVKLKYKV